MSDEKCLRNMSCKCRLCMGEDVEMLQTISRSIRSSVQYVVEEGDTHIEAVSSTLQKALSHPKIAREVQNSPHLTRKTDVEMERNTEAEVTMEIAHKEKKGLDMQQSRNTTSALPKIPTSTMECDIRTSQSIPPAPVSLKNPPVSKIDEESISQIATQVSDKSWKIRKEAYEKMDFIWKSKPFSDTATSALLCHVEKLCQDSNASALEAGLQAVTSYVENVPSLQKSIVPNLMKGIMDKGFSGRPGTVTLCEALILKLIESGATEETVQALIEGTKHKKPKVPPACVSSLLQSLELFGPRVISIPLLKSALPTLCESTVNNVRPLALKLLVEIHRWTGPVVIQDIVSNLRHAQQTEFEALTIDVVPGRAQPIKYVKGMAPKGENGRSSSTNLQSTTKSKSPLTDASALDPREFVETVHLMEKLAKTEYRAKIGSAKWKDKVAALKIVLDVIGPVPKLANGDYGDLITTLKLSSQDSNVNIVATAFEIVGALADGLRRQFTHYARVFVPILMSKLSDKKTMILQSTNLALDAIQKYVLPLDQQMEDLRMWVDPTKNKAPQARVQTIRFMERSLIHTEDQESSEKYAMTAYVANIEPGQQTAIFTTCGQILCQAAEDVDPTVRKAAMDAIVRVHNVSNGALQQQLAAISRSNARVHKLIEAGLSASARASNSSVSSESKSVGEKEVRSAGGTRRRSTLAGKKAPASNSSAASAASAASAPVSGGVNDTCFKTMMTAEEAEEILSDSVGADWQTVQAEISSTKWIERRHAIELLESFASSQNLSSRVIEAFVCHLARHTKDFKDSNINVLKSTFQAIGTLASHSSRFPRSIVSMLVPPSVDKLSDRKVSDIVRRMILAFSEATHPEYVVGCILAHVPSTKSPLVHIEVVEVISTLIKDFGMTHCGPRALVEYIKGTQGLESSNAKCRSASIALLGAMYQQVGPAILPILQLDTWKPALATLAEKEFEKAGYDASTAMNSVVRSARGSSKETSDESGNARRSSSRKSADSSLMNLFGRQDISNLITKELLSDLRCEDDKAAWKKRLAAIESVQSICEQTGCAIEFTKSVGELIRALKPRLSDSNANLKVKAAQVLGVLATSIGPEVAKMSKLVGPMLLSGCSDNKKNLQIASLDTLQRWVKHQSTTSIACMESLLIPLSEQLSNPVGRAEILDWAAENLKNCAEQTQRQPMDLTVLVVPTVQCLLDRSPETREKAQQLLLEVLRSVGLQTVLSVGCRDIKPAKMRTLQPIILKLMESITEAQNSAMNQEEDVPMRAASVSSNNEEPIPSENDSSMTSVSQSGRVGRQHGGRLGALRASRSLRRSLDVRDSTPKDSMENPGRAQCGRDSINEGVSLSRCTEAQKAARLTKAQFSRWIFDSTSQLEMSTRKAEIESDWRPLCSRELADQLFAESLEKGMMAGISNLLTCLVQQPDDIIPVLDLIFKWITLRIVDNNVQALAKVLELLVSLFTLLQKRKYVLEDAEAGILLPFVLQESGHAKPRFRLRYRELLRQISDVIPCEKYTLFLLDCINTTKNMKSRCECIDTVEYLLNNGRELSSVGKKILREIAKLVSAHERDVRECAINTMVAAFNRTDGNLERFFRLVQVSTQQGMDLIRAKIKHLPSVARSEPQSSRLGSKESIVQINSDSVETDAFIGLDSEAPKSSTLHDDDVVMDPPDRNVASQSHCRPEVVTENGYVHTDDTETDEDSRVVETLLMRPMRRLITKDMKLTEDQTDLKNGIDAMKALCAIAGYPIDAYEVDFLVASVNEIVQKLCECIRVSFEERKTDHTTSHLEAFPPFDIQMRILSLSVATLRAVLSNPMVADHLQRYTIERLLLVGCSTMQHPCLQDASPNVIQDPEKELDTPDKKRHYMIIRALYHLILHVLGRLNVGEVFPSIINLLQRIIRNDVGEYSAYNSYNHLMKKDSLDQLVGRILIHVSKQQAAALVPFEGVDIFGVLMQMHSFFATLPQSDMFAAHGADETMQEALKIIASGITRHNPLSFRNSTKLLPSDSPVLALLCRHGILAPKEIPAGTNADTTVMSSLQSNVPQAPSIDDGGTVSAQERMAAPIGNPQENVSRRLFHGTAFPSPSGSTTQQNHSRLHAGILEDSSSRLSTTQSIRERLDRVRKF